MRVRRGLHQRSIDCINIRKHNGSVMQVLAYVMQLVGVAVVSVPISYTGMLHYPRQTQIHYSVGLLVQALAFIQVHSSQAALTCAIIAVSALLTHHIVSLPS